MKGSRIPAAHPHPEIPKIPPPPVLSTHDSKPTPAVFLIVWLMSKLVCLAWISDIISSRFSPSANYWDKLKIRSAYLWRYWGFWCSYLWRFWSLSWRDQTFLTWFPFRLWHHKIKVRYRLAEIYTCKRRRKLKLTLSGLIHYIKVFPKVSQTDPLHQRFSYFRNIHS